MREFVIPFATGLALFLFGMQILRIGLLNLSGKYLKIFLQSFTKTPYHGFFTGTIATLLLQSSSAVSVITIGLTNARMITFYQTIGIILGANVGTVATAELIALNISKLAIPLLICGIFLIIITKQKIRALGLSLSGFAIIFLGMDTLQSISSFLQESNLFQIIISNSEQKIFIGLALGLIITAIIQSSSATTAITMSLICTQNFPLEFGIAIILGSNIGTCFTAILASLGGSLEGKQVATAHVLLNVIGVIIFLPFIDFLCSFIEILTTNPATQIAHAQLVFNLIISLIMLPFVKPFSRLTVFLTRSN